MEIAALQGADIGAAFIGGYAADVALMARLAHARGYPLQLVADLSLASEDFGLIAGSGAEGTLFVDVANPRGRVEAVSVRHGAGPDRLRPEG